MYPIPFEAVWVGNRWVDAVPLPNPSDVPSAIVYADWKERVE